MQHKIDNYRAKFGPRGVLDIKRAIEIAYVVGEDEDWAADLLIELAHDCRVPERDMDPVYVVLSQIEQEARTDIDNITGKDICNDCEGHMAVYGNYLDSSFDYDDTFRDWLIGILKGIDIGEFNRFTRYFLNELNIDPTDLKINENE
jgi:hypothetical protein